MIEKQSFTTRLGNWVDGLPDTIRPAVFGALIIVMFMMVRGAWLVVPFAIVYVLATSSTPAADLARGMEVVLFAMFAGAMSGLVYGLLGRHLKRAFPGGRYMTGIVTIAPYMFLLPLISRLIDGKPVRTALSTGDIVIAGSMTVIFGLAMGHSWFGPDKAAQADPERPT
jgi:xanthosine utilization system XapX-like protein